MSTSNRRKAARVTTGFPVKVVTSRSFVEAVAVDVSRTGIRLRIPCAALGIEVPRDATEAAERVAAVLADAFAVNLHHERLGPLLPREVRLHRVGLPMEARKQVDLCCEFDRPLGDEEAAILEVQLPPIDGGAGARCEEADLPRTCGGRMSFDPEEEELALPIRPRRPAPARPPRYRAFVGSLELEGPAAIFCETDLVTAVGVRVRMRRSEGLHLPGGEAPSVKAAAENFVRHFGSQVDLRVVNGSGAAWTGPARVSGVELPANAKGDLLVTLAFDRRLRPSELRKLGLVEAAA